jgi:hypothetical protein
MARLVCFSEARKICSEKSRDGLAERADVVMYEQEPNRSAESVRVTVGLLRTQTGWNADGKAEACAKSAQISGTSRSSRRSEGDTDGREHEHEHKQERQQRRIEPNGDSQQHQPIARNGARTRTRVRSAPRSVDRRQAAPSRGEARSSPGEA